MAVCILMYATNLVAQTAKIPIEIHIKDKEAVISIDGTPYPENIQSLQQKHHTR